MHNLMTYSKQFTLFIAAFSKLAFSRISFPISLIIQIRNVRAGWPLFHCGYRQYSLSKCCQFLTNSWVEFPSNSSRFLYAYYSCLFQELSLSLSLSPRYTSHAIRFTTKKHTIHWVFKYIHKVAQLSLPSNDTFITPIPITQLQPLATISLLSVSMNLPLLDTAYK